MSESNNLFNQAKALLASGDRSYATFEKLNELAEASTDDTEGEMIGDLISAFYADGGETMPDFEVS